MLAISSAIFGYQWGDNHGTAESGEPISYRLTSLRGDPNRSDLVSGWQISGSQVVMREQAAEVYFRPRTATGTDVPLVLDGSGKLLPGEGQREIAVTVNDEPVGSLKLDRDGARDSASLTVPAAVFNRYFPVIIHLQSNSVAGGFELASLQLGEYQARGILDGWVDVCRGTSIAGWAAEGKSITPVTILRNGKTLATITPSVERPDLLKAGKPRNAGFAYSLTTPLQSGDIVRVTFANGADLNRSPCNVP